MKRPGSRHYTEEELLMHYLLEETAEAGREISAHLQECSECRAVFEEYGDLVERIRGWAVPEIQQEAWQAQKAILLAHYREDTAGGRRRGLISSLQKSLLSAWNYALENPLPTLAYIAVAIAFALERTISTFRLDRLLPGASEVFEILRQVF
jgi:predicted anti-sigma-YlaC factor YlaD